jgi:hypothetical protein
VSARKIPDPAITNRDLTAVSVDRPRLGTIDNGALDRMNETYHFKNDSKMSIQAGKLQQMQTHTSPIAKPVFGKN